LSKKVKKTRKFTRTMQKKLAALFILILLALIGLNLRVSMISAKSGDKYKKEVLSQQRYDSRTLPYKRGDIKDRNGTILATSTKVYNLVIDCKAINEEEKGFVEPTIRALVDYLNVDEEQVRGILTNEDTKNSQYQVLRKEVSAEEKKEFEDYLTIPEDSNLSKEEKALKQKVQGIWFEDEYLRTYQYNSLASNALGFSNKYNQGNTGLEGWYSEELNGVDGREFGYLNEDSELLRTTIKPVNGNNIVSTLDFNIQSIVEKYIAQFEEEHKDGPQEETKGKGSVATTVIVADPQNGAILAMATSNNYDLNNPQDLSKYYTEEEIESMDEEATNAALNELWKNYAISNTIELGSTFKPMTVAAALDSASVEEDAHYFCGGKEIVADREIKCANVNGHGDESLGDVLKNSCNVGIMQISRAMGIQNFQKYQSIFNFGRTTGIDLPGEEQGALHLGDKMQEVELATDSFGQGFTATMVQEVAAFSSVINGGYYYKPRMVGKIEDADGNLVKSIDPILLKQVISKSTSEILRGFLQRGIEEGTGHYAKVEGYSMGGKTGTAEQFPRGNGKYLVSFIGFAPVDNPKVVVYVVVDRPNVEEQAQSQFAQEIAKNIFTDILPYLNVAKDEGVAAEKDQEETTDSEAQNIEGEQGEGREAGIEYGAENTDIPAPPEEENLPEGEDEQSKTSQEQPLDFLQDEE
jgi:stage V sporulation protein D (sporulation-specific penicillin-binding protein)